jgi:hypothetical protein
MYKLAVVIIPAHWDPRDLVHPSVNEMGTIRNGMSIREIKPDENCEQVIGAASDSILGIKR